jgi:hypothetical protein
LETIQCSKAKLSKLLNWSSSRYNEYTKPQAIETIINLVSKGEDCSQEFISGCFSAGAHGYGSKAAFKNSKLTGGNYTLNIKNGTAQLIDNNTKDTFNLEKPASISLRPKKLKRIFYHGNKHIRNDPVKTGEYDVIWESPRKTGVFHIKYQDKIYFLKKYYCTVLKTEIKHKEQTMTEADQKKLDRVNQLINEKADIQVDGSLRISSEDWRGIKHELNKTNIEKNKLFEDAIRNIGNETAAILKQSESPPLERRNINSKENFMSISDAEMDELQRQAEEDPWKVENETADQTRNPKEEAFLNTVHQRKVIADALKAGKLSCLPGADGLADTQPAVNLVNGTFYHGTNLLFLKEHQKENGFPSAEYLTAGQIDKAHKDNPDLFIRKGQKGVSIYVSEKNEETGEYENKNFRLFNVAQTTKPAAMKEWAEQQRQEKLQEKLEYLQTQYGTGYKLPEPKQKGPGPEIVCSSTEPKEYLGQYLAAVSVGGKFKASPEQAAEFAQKLEGTLFERMENGHTNPFKLEKISIEASQYCKEFIPKALAEARKAEQPQQQQEQAPSRGRGL